MIWGQIWGQIWGPFIEVQIDLGFVLQGFEHFWKNLSDVRTGRAFGGGEHNTFVSSELCVRELRGPSDICEEHRWA